MLKVAIQQQVDKSALELIPGVNQTIQKELYLAFTMELIRNNMFTIKKTLSKDNEDIVIFTLNGWAANEAEIKRTINLVDNVIEALPKKDKHKGEHLKSVIKTFTPN